jgi:hypothetical protein
MSWAHSFHRVADTGEVMADGQEIAGNNGTENRALTVRGNPDKTIPYRYKPGQSGNPGGRPKRKPIQDELEKIFEENPELVRKIVYKAAIKAAQGNHKFFCEVRDMMDGKLAAPLFGEDNSSMSVTVNIEAARKKLFGDDE